jgi:hypothetical protein
MIFIFHLNCLILLILNLIIKLELTWSVTFWIYLYSGRREWYNGAVYYLKIFSGGRKCYTTTLLFNFCTTKDNYLKIFRFIKEIKKRSGWLIFTLWWFADAGI